MKKYVVEKSASEAVSVTPCNGSKSKQPTKKSAVQSRSVSQRRKTIYFCVGDFRTGKKQYRIFKVRTVDDAYKVADALGYKIVLDDYLKDNFISDPAERDVIAILTAIEMNLKMAENVVSCHREERTEAQRMRRHFLDTDVSEYFPKLLPVPEKIVIDDKTFRLERRTYPWILEYYARKQKSASQVPQFQIFTD